MQTTFRYTTANLEAMPESHDGTRYEIIDGELFVSSHPSWEHQFAVTTLMGALFGWSRVTGLGLTNTPGIIFSDYDNVIPDLVWISHARLRESLQADGKLHSAPELVVEILSPGAENVRRDREAKLNLYDRTGAAEYWIVDWRSKTIDVFRRDADRLAFVATLSGDVRLTSPTLPGFDIALEEIWWPGLNV